MRAISCRTSPRSTGFFVLGKLVFLATLIAASLSLAFPFVFFIPELVPPRALGRRSNLSAGDFERPTRIQHRTFGLPLRSSAPHSWLPQRFQHRALGCPCAFSTALLVAAALSAPCFWLRQRFRHRAFGCGSAFSTALLVAAALRHCAFGCRSAFNTALLVAAALSAPRSRLPPCFRRNAFGWRSAE